MAPLRIALDGYNLALEQGTGVATYGRVLSRALHALGHEVGILYGKENARQRDALLQEVTFFDPNVLPKGKLARIARDVKRVALSGREEVAFPVPVTGRVVLDALQSQLPYFDRIWNGNRLFNAAITSFRYTKKLTSVAVPEGGVDVMHWTYPVPVRMTGARNVYTLHDLVPLRLPYTTLDRKGRYLALCKAIARSDAHIVTVSESSRRDIVELLGIPEHRVSNTFQSFDLPREVVALPEDRLQHEIEDLFGLGYREYFLFFGAIEPKKNIARLVNAYLLSGSRTPLVIVGKKAWKSDDELRIMKVHQDMADFLTPGGSAGGGNGDQAGRGAAGRNHGRTKHLEYMPGNLLFRLVRGARAVLFPSIYEGFGLPVLEAMALGTAVMTSNVSSLPEVAGEAALQVDPYDVPGMAATIRRLDTDTALREALERAGPGQAAQFSMERYQERLQEVYRRVAAA